MVYKDGYKCLYFYFIRRRTSEPDCRRLLDALERDLVADERADVVDAIAKTAESGLLVRTRSAVVAHRIIVGRSSEMPQPWTCTSLGKPMGSSISGRNMPLLPTSTHFFSCGWKAKISKEGCVR